MIGLIQGDPGSRAGMAHCAHYGRIEEKAHWSLPLRRIFAAAAQVISCARISNPDHD